MLASFALSIALSSANLVPPGEMVVDHSQPGHFAQPTIRRFEREQEDNDRRVAWESYVRELDILWQEYEDAGSTSSAWRTYIQAVKNAKRRYVFADPYLAPVIND